MTSRTDSNSTSARTDTDSASARTESGSTAGPTTLRVSRLQRVLETRLSNPLLRWLLRSRLHPLASRWLVLVSYEGHRSGHTYTFPVAYARDGDGLVVATPAAESVWWRNFREPRSCTVWSAGRARAATGELLEGEGSGRASALSAYAARHPVLGRSLGFDASDRIPGPSELAVVRFVPADGP